MILPKNLFTSENRVFKYLTLFSFMLLIFSSFCFAQIKEDTISKDDYFKTLIVNDAINKKAIFTYDNIEKEIKETEYIKIKFIEVCGKVKSYKIINPNIKLGLNNIEFDADIEYSLCSDGTYGYKIDWVPYIIKDSKIIENIEWAWWNVSYQYKYNINTSLLSNGLPVYINGSGGVNLNGTFVYPIIYSQNGNLSLYYNNENDYKIILNDSIVINEISSSENNLIAYYKMFGNNNDVLGNANGTDSGTLTNQTGIINAGRKFDDGYSTTTAYDPMNLGASNFTINFWHKGGTNERVAISSARETTFAALIGYQSGALGMLVYMDLGANNWACSPGISMGTWSNTDWYMFTVVRRGSNVSTYRNGVFMSSTNGCTGTIANVDNTWDFARGQANNDANVQLDEVSFFNDSLTIEKISQIYNNTNNILGFGNIYSNETYVSNETTPEIPPVESVIDAWDEYLFLDFTDFNHVVIFGILTILYISSLIGFVFSRNIVLGLLSLFLGFFIGVACYTLSPLLTAVMIFVTIILFIFMALSVKK